MCRMSGVWCNGHMGENRPGEPPSSASWGVFTTVGCDRGRPLLWSRHHRRLAASLVALRAEDVVRLPTEHELCELLDANGLLGPARLRVVVRWAEPSEWLVEASASPCDVVGPALKPARLTVESWPSAPPLAGHKTLARMAWDMARERAQRAGCDDALLVDEAGNLLETSIANVLVVRDGAVRTPHAPTRCLPGVMRAWLLEHLGRADLSTGACELTVDDLASADEIWLSNAIIGVRRVGSVGDQQWQEWPHFGSLAHLGIPAPGWDDVA